MTWPYPLTHPSTHPPTHPPMGGGVSTNHKSSNRTELSWFSQHHPPTHQTIHPPMGGEFFRFQIFKRNWNILISSSVIEFILILGVHPLGGWQMGAWGWGWVWVCGGCPMHTHMHAHARTCMLNMLIMLNMDASMLAAICNFYTCIHVCMCMCVRACVCGGTPPMPPDAPDTPPTHLPPPQSCREPKTAKFNKSWTNRDNSILFKDSLPLNIPELI